MVRRRRSRTPFAAFLILATGCSQTPRPAASAPAPLENLTPTQVVERLIELHEKRDYAGIERWTLPQRREALLSSLRALDEFLAANEALCTHARQRLPLGAAESIDFTRLARNMDVFSPYVVVLGESIESETAEVTFQVNSGFPLRRATLRRFEERWRYDPGVGFDESVPAAFREMAGGLRDVLGELQSGRLAEAAIRQDHRVLIEAIERRLEPALRRLRTGAATQPSASRASEP